MSTYFLSVHSPTLSCYNPVFLCSKHRFPFPSFPIVWEFPFIYAHWIGQLPILSIYSFHMFFISINCTCLFFRHLNLTISCLFFAICLEILNIFFILLSQDSVLYSHYLWSRMLCNSAFESLSGFIVIPSFFRECAFISTIL